MFFRVLHEPEFNGPASGFNKMMYVVADSLGDARTYAGYIGKEFVEGIDKKPVRNWEVREMSDKEWNERQPTFKNVNGWTVPVVTVELEY